MVFAGLLVAAPGAHSPGQTGTHQGSRDNGVDGSRPRHRVRLILITCWCLIFGLLLVLDRLIRWHQRKGRHLQRAQLARMQAMMAGQMRQPEDRQEPMTSDDMTITATERARRAGELLRQVEHGATITIIGARHGWTRSVISPRRSSVAGAELRVWLHLGGALRGHQGGPAGGRRDGLKG